MKRVIFFHCHKAGGTTVVDAAKRSGFKLPQSHANGNPLDAEGKLINWSRLSDEETLQTFSSLYDEGVNFFCFEFSVPKWSLLSAIENLHFITVLREPLARSYSNFKMDILNRYIDPVKISEFSKYTNGDNLVQSNNFYTRFFSGLKCWEPVNENHLENAIRIINQFDAVSILERGNLSQRLAPLGFDPASFGWQNSTMGKKKFEKYDEENEKIKIKSYPVITDFQKNNTLDYALYSYFLHKDVERDYDS
jgi:hypothetical protein